MTGRNRENPARDEYAAALARAVRDQAVAEAEGLVGDAWLAELESLRDASERGVALTLTAYRAAEAALRDARRRGDARAVAEAKRHVARGRDAVRKSATVAELTLRLAARELDALTAARRGHARIARENLARLRAARRNTLDSGVGEAHRK